MQIDRHIIAKHSVGPRLKHLRGLLGFPFRRNESGSHSLQSRCTEKDQKRRRSVVHGSLELEIFSLLEVGITSNSSEYKWLPEGFRFKLRVRL